MGEPRSVDLLAEIRAVLDALEDQLRDHVVDIEMPRLQAQTDPEVLRRTLTRLVAEVARRSQPGHSITVRTSRRAQGSGTAQRQVAQVEVVEESGASRADQAQDYLGLSAVAQDVHASGGEFGVSSELGCSPTFWFTVPLPAGASGAPDA